MKRELEQLQNRLKVRKCFNKHMKPLKKLVHDESAAACWWCLCLFRRRRWESEQKPNWTSTWRAAGSLTWCVRFIVWCPPQINFMFSSVSKWSSDRCLYIHEHTANRKCRQIIQQTLIKTIWVNVNTFGLKRKKSSAHFVFFCQFTEQEKKLMEASTDFHHKVNRL